jgi:NADH-quinone oxidoreductase subunit M
MLVPHASAATLEATGVLALVTAVYGAIAAAAQADARRAFGYLFVSQSALVFAGLECDSVEGLTGGLSLWLSTGIAFSALARCLAVLEARRGRLSLDRLNGGYDRMPLLASSFLLTALAAVGLPGTLGFIGHELLVEGAVAQHPRTGFLVVIATAFGGIAVLRIYFSLFCGRRDRGPYLGLRSREVAIVASFSALLLAAGLLPRPVLDSRAAAAQEILAGREAREKLPG